MCIEDKILVDICFGGQAASAAYLAVSCCSFSQKEIVRHFHRILEEGKTSVAPLSEREGQMQNAN